VGEGDAGSHARDVLLGVEPVAVDECDAQAPGEQAADRGLAGTLHSHDDDGRNDCVHVMASLAGFSFEDMPNSRTFTRPTADGYDLAMPESAAAAHDHGFVASRTVDTPGLHSRVLDELGQAICEGRLAAGTIVTTEALASRYQVSRSVIRESLRTLAAMGMVASKQRVGNRILPLSEWNVYDPGVIRWRLAGRARLEQLRSITELRTAIEPEAARLAAHRGTLAQAGELVGLAGRL